MVYAHRRVQEDAQKKERFLQEQMKRKKKDGGVK